MSNFEGMPDYFDENAWQPQGIGDDGAPRPSLDDPMLDSGLHPGNIPDTNDSQHTATQPDAEPGFEHNRLFVAFAGESRDVSAETRERVWSLSTGTFAFQWLGDGPTPPALQIYLEPQRHAPPADQPLSDEGAYELVDRQITSRSGILRVYSHVRDGIEATGLLHENVTRDVPNGVAFSRPLLPDELRSGIRAGQYILKTGEQGHVILRENYKIAPGTDGTAFQQYDTPDGQTFLISNDHRIRLRIIHRGNEIEEPVVIYDSPKTLAPYIPDYLAELNGLLRQHKLLLDHLTARAGINPDLFEQPANDKTRQAQQAGSQQVKTYVQQHGIPQELLRPFTTSTRLLFETIRPRRNYDPISDTLVEGGLRSAGANILQYYNAILHSRP